MAGDLDSLAALVTAFRDARDWSQFHSLRNLIVSLNLHAREALEDECADVLLYLLLIADRAGIDLDAATRTKLAKNEAKYPVERFRGSRRKYDAPE